MGDINKEGDDSLRCSSLLAAHLAAALEPRYMFAASIGIFYQRPPFRSPLYGYVSRFTSLGVIGVKTPEAKALHALQLQPIDTLLSALPSLAYLPDSLRPLPTTYGEGVDTRGTRRVNATSMNVAEGSTSDVTTNNNTSTSNINSRMNARGAQGQTNTSTTDEVAGVSGGGLKVEAALAALSMLPENTTASPFTKFLPYKTQEELLQKQKSRGPLFPVYGPSLPPHSDSGSRVLLSTAATAHKTATASAGSSITGSLSSYFLPASAAKSRSPPISLSPPPPPPSPRPSPPPPPPTAERSSHAPGHYNNDKGLRQRSSRPCCVVAVSNLPYYVDDTSLQKVMEAFGDVKFIYAPRDSQDPLKGTGQAYVVFMEPQSAEKAVLASGQLEAGRRVLRTTFWREKIPFAHRQGQQHQKDLPKAGTVLITEAHADCWFCLANPKVEKHLVAAVGDACYVAAPKGGLHPLHALVIPITHFPSLAVAPADVREEVGRQVETYRRALKQQENLDCIVYERYVPMRATKAMHTQVQCVPCTAAQGYRAAEIFKKKAKAAGFTLQALECTQKSPPFSELPQLVAGTERAYLYVDLPGMVTASGHRAERLFYCQPCRENVASSAGGHGGGRHDSLPRLPMNFGRHVVATVIEKPEMADWQNCMEDHSQEVTRAAQLTRLLSE